MYTSNIRSKYKIRMDRGWTHMDTGPPRERGARSYTYGRFAKFHRVFWAETLAH